MATLFLAVLFGCVWSAAGQSDLMKLSGGYRVGVELAVEQVNTHQGVQHHFRFFKSLNPSELSSQFGTKYLSHHFLLKATRCAKGTAAANSSKCAFRNRPQIDCMTCYKTYQDEIQDTPKPYIHCIHKAALTKEILNDRRDHCENKSYSAGSVTLLGSGRKS